MAKKLPLQNDYPTPGQVALALKLATMAQAMEIGSELKKSPKEKKKRGA